MGLVEAGGVDAASDGGEIGVAVDAVVGEVEGGPVVPAVDGEFDVGELDAGSADGYFAAVVGSVSVGDGGDQLAGSIEDPGSFGGA
jgi:hypothetical protein